MLYLLFLNRENISQGVALEFVLKSLMFYNSTLHNFLMDISFQFYKFIFLLNCLDLKAIFPKYFPALGFSLRCSHQLIEFHIKPNLRFKYYLAGCSTTVTLDVWTVTNSEMLSVLQ